MTQAPTRDRLVHAAVFGGRTVVGYSSTQALQRLDWLIREHQVSSVIEVGSYVGLSACFFAERVPDVVCVDTFDAASSATFDAVGIHEVEDQYQAFLVNTLAYPNIRHVVMPSLEAARLPLSADLVYIDGEHTYEAVRADIEAWRPKARKVLCGDDNLDDRFGVTRAVRDAGVANRRERIWWETY